LMPEEEAAELLGIAEWRLRELASLGELRLVRVEGTEGQRVMYFAAEVLALRERLRGRPEACETETADDDEEEWPDLIGE
jgi:hypothetical protein